MSDCHDNWLNLEKAVNIANQENCEYLLFAGDLIAPPMVQILEKFNGKIELVWGNNEGEKVALTRMFDSSEKITLHGVAKGDYYEGEIDGIKIFMQHYPKIVELAAKSGDYDLCIHGHNHLYSQSGVGHTLVLNPGEIQGLKTGEPSFIIFDTKTKGAAKIDL